MMKKIKFSIAIFLALSGILFLGLSARADELPPDDTATSTDETATTTPDTTSDATTTPDVTATSTPTKTVTLHIRNGSNMIFEGDVTVDEGETVNVLDDTNTSHEVASDSVLAVLEKADTESDAFSLSDLAYYSSFDSFLINCIDSPDHLCYNWQYVVSGNYPFVGINAYTVKDGDNVYIYFGPQKQLSFGTTSVVAGTPFTVTAQSYDYENNAWNAVPNATIGETIPNPSDPYNPTELATSTTDTNGDAAFTINTPGTYNFGFKDDYYYPLYPITITATTTESGGDTGGSHGGGGSTHNAPDVEKMFSFLDSKQNPDGSFGGDLYTDWTAIAYGTTNGHSTAKTALKNFLKTDTLEGTSATDYERRAMALMSVGLSPYTDGKDNYIQKILATFDGTQFGSKSFYNDDIFAVIALKNAGYTKNDTEIKSAIDYIVSKQKSDGSFESPDVTAAAIQALSIGGENDAITKAKNYLRSIQNADGGFSNIPATAWIIQALGSVGTSATSITGVNGNNPLDYLFANQMTDGGIDGADANSRVWNTSYVVNGVSGESWSNTMESFDKPETTTNSSGSGNSNTTNNEVIATTTAPIIATTTPTIIPTIVTVPTHTPTLTNEVKNIAKTSSTEPTSTTTATSTEPSTDIKENLAYAGGKIPNSIPYTVGGIAIGGGVFILIRKWILGL